jgi:putative transposase
MAQKRHTPEQIVMKLREAERLQGQGETVAAVCKRLRITDVTLHRWKVKYGSLKENEAARLKALELENERLKRIVAEKELELTIMRDVAQGKF